MFTCRDCGDYVCTSWSSDQPACDDFTLEELAEENPIFDERAEHLADMQGHINALEERLSDLERDFHAIIASIVKAYADEDSR